MVNSEERKRRREDGRVGGEEVGRLKGRGEEEEGKCK